MHALAERKRMNGGDDGDKGQKSEPTRWTEV